MSKIARITAGKKLLLSNKIIEGDKVSLNADGTLYVNEVIEDDKFSIGGELIEVNELIEGYPFVKPVIDNSLVLWLDGSTGNNYEQTGTWKDLSGKNNHGTLKNFVYNDNSGWKDDGLIFDGVDDYVDCGNDSSLNLTDGITIETIAECTVAEFFPLTKGQNEAWASNSYGLRNAIFYISDDTNTLTQLQTNIPANKLIHTIVRTSSELGKLECWIDGELKYSTNRDGSNIKLSNYPVQIGTTYGSVRKAGKVKHVRMYNRTLTDEEIIQNYQAGQCSPLLAIQDGTVVEFPRRIKTEKNKSQFIIPQMTVTKELPLFITLDNIETNESESESSYVDIMLMKNTDEIVTPVTIKKDDITYRKKYIYNNTENYVATEELVPEDTPYSNWDIQCYPKDESKNIYHGGIILIPEDNIKLFIYQNTLFEISFDINIRKFAPDGVIVHSMRTILPSFCYLTTAMVGYFGKDDDGIELTAMRELRSHSGYKYQDVLGEYYKISPYIINGIEQSGNKDYYYNMIKDVVDNIVILVANKKWEEAETAYLELYYYLKEKFGGCLNGTT